MMPSSTEIPRLARGEDAVTFERTPFILPRGACGWESLRDATLARLLARCGDTKIEARVDLPDDGVPYVQDDARHNVTITLSELAERIDRGERCYGPQIDVGNFAGFQPSADLDRLLPPGFRVINLWVGARTKSGLHYDAMDNLFVQIDGVKNVMLAAPSNSRALYPFPDTPTKSRIDPERPDVAAFPRLSRATFLTGTVEPSDMIYIPRGWWHFLSAPGPSVSLNCWFGAPMTPGEQMKAVTVTDPLAWGTILLDAVRYGVARRPYPRRLLSSAPAGKALYELLASQAPWRKRKLR